MTLIKAKILHEFPNKSNKKAITILATVSTLLGLTVGGLLSDRTTTFASSVLLDPSPVNHEQEFRDKIRELGIQELAAYPSPAPTKKPEIKFTSQDYTYVQDYICTKDWSCEQLKKVAFCESSFNPSAQSDHSSAGGLYQIINSTWVENRKAMGRSTNLELKYDYQENTDTAHFIYKHRGLGPWKASEWCWEK